MLLTLGRDAYIIHKVPLDDLGERFRDAWVVDSDCVS